MKIQLAETVEEIARCYPVMAQLRTHLSEAEFVRAVERQQQEGYHLVFAADEDSAAVKAVAGFRLMEMLVCGKFLYVDDLVTDAGARSQGHGAALLEWLGEYARARQCKSLQLDSGIKRFAAHRFYFNKRMWISAYHFALQLSE
jgi:GNAT superfamily N-acetyltransferase